MVITPTSFLRAVEHRIVRKKLWQHLLLRRSTSMTDDEFRKLFRFSKAGSTFCESFHASIRLRFFFHPRNQKDFFLQLLTRGQSMESILEEADDVMHNRFETLGSGKVSLGDSINWQKDFKSGLDWPLEPSWKLDVLDLSRPSDIKVPWELSRFHQVWWLGKAYWLTHNEQYAEKFRTLIEDWLENNPPGRGVNWVLAMEASIRACNWIAGYYFFCESKSLSDEFWIRFWKSLYVHAIFIRNNLEYALPNGNHFLSNVVGLVFLGIFFQNASAGKEWLSLGVRSLQEEMDRQVYEDGVDWEKSISYHRLMLEFFYTSAILCSLYNVKLPLSFRSRLEKMFEYTMHYMRPDGSVPNVGDGDDGRLFRFAMAEDVTDHRHALSVGAILFERSDFKEAAGKFYQDTLWLFGGEGFEKHQLLKPSSRPHVSVAFPAGGVYILNSERAHLFVDVDDIGLRGRVGHGHNDVLSFELWADGSLLIVDSGCYGYSFDVAARNEFRSTKAHNTLLIDGKELAEFPSIWKVKKEARGPDLIQWKPGGDRELLVAEQYCYQPLGVVHRRRFVFDRMHLQVEITDTVEGSGEHAIESFLHFAPAVSIERKDPYTAVAIKDSRRYIITALSGEWSIHDTWYSRSYGLRTRNQTLKLWAKVRLPVAIKVTIQSDEE